MHLDLETIERWRHGEIEAGDRRAVQAHLEECAACRLRVEEAQREEELVSSLLREVDTDPPRVGAAVVIARGGRQGSRRRWRWGFGLLLGVGLGAAYAMPGSPLRDWVEATLRRGTGPASIERETHEAPPAAPGPSSSGVSVVPGPRFSIEFPSSAIAGSAEVSFTDGEKLSVRCTEGAASFTSDVDRLRVTPSTSRARFVIEIPRDAHEIAITVAGSSIFHVVGGRIVSTVAAAPNERGAYRLPLAPVEVR